MGLLRASFALSLLVTACGDVVLGAHGSPDGAAPVEAGADGTATVTGTKISSFCAGQNHACVVKEGKLLCWGLNGSGQLGDGTTTNQGTPVAATSVSKVPDAVEVGCGTEWTCSRHASGVVSCWGVDHNGFLGGEKPQGPTTRAGLDDVKRLFVGGAHSCVLRNSGDVLCWGWNAFGQIGNGQVAQTVAEPTKVEGLTDVVELSLGFQHTCALHEDKTVSCWGNNDGGQLGDGTNVNRSTPTKVPGLTDVARLSHGGLASITCATKADGTARCWGANQLGQLGDGTYESRSTATPVTILGSRSIVELTAGNSWTCALDTTQAAHCWGGNDKGQIGNGESSLMAVTKAFEVPGVGPVRRIEAGTFHTCALTVDDQVFCWGEGGAGQLGNGASTSSLTPTKVLLP